MGKSIRVTTGAVTKRQGEDGTGVYYDIAVTADGVSGKVSPEADGQPLRGSNDRTDYMSKQLVALGPDVADEVVAVAATALP